MVSLIERSKHSSPAAFLQSPDASAPPKVARRIMLRQGLLPGLLALAMMGPMSSRLWVG